MIETTQLLHNMSAPPRSIVKYNGLSNESAKTSSADAKEAPLSDGGVFGSFIAFRMPVNLRRCGAKTILQRLGLEPGLVPEETLVALIEAQARNITLPDACVVVPTKASHPNPWTDPLTVLAIITKSSARIWLRSKTPRLTVLRKTTAISLLAPPTFTQPLEAQSS
jgi:hypothetical protein